MAPEDPPPTSTPPPPPQTPLGLDYFSLNEPQQGQARRSDIGYFIVLAGLLPYACGVINRAVASNTYSAAIRGAHIGGARLLMGAGIGISLLAILWFIRKRNGIGIAFGALVLLLQVSVVACIAIMT